MNVCRSRSSFLDRWSETRPRPMNRGRVPVSQPGGTASSTDWQSLPEGLFSFQGASARALRFERSSSPFRPFPASPTSPCGARLKRQETSYDGDRDASPDPFPCPVPSRPLRGDSLARRGGSGHSPVDGRRRRCRALDRRHPQRNDRVGEGVWRRERRDTSATHRAGDLRVRLPWKTVLAYAVLRLVDAGVLSLDVPLQPMPSRCCRSCGAGGDARAQRSLSLRSGRSIATRSPRVVNFSGQPQRSLELVSLACMLRFARATRIETP
jgi:hypothetical protein